MALRWTKPLREMGTRVISWGKSQPVRKAENLTTILYVVTKSWNLNFLEPSGPLEACNGTDLLLGDLHLATLTAVSFYCLHNDLTLHQS